MKATFFDGEKMSFDKNYPKPKSDETLVRVNLAGICGTDLHYYKHGGFGQIKLKEPMVLGHEVSGYISKLGSNVTDLTIGQLVSVSPSRPCNNCEFCLEGSQNHCLNMKFYGSAMPFPHIQGAFRETLIAEDYQCIPADGLSAGEAAMAEPLAVCLHAISQAENIFGKKVLITGSGPIGTLCVLRYWHPRGRLGNIIQGAVVLVMPLSRYHSSIGAASLSTLISVLQLYDCGNEPDVHSTPFLKHLGPCNA